MSRRTLDTARSLPDSRTGLSPPLAGFPKTVPLPSRSLFAVRTPACTHAGLGSSAFARRYSRNRVFFLFLRVLRCFSSPGSLPVAMYLPRDAIAGGFPHSEISGSWAICASPELFAAYRVLHRLLVPRHPPCALCSLIFVQAGARKRIGRRTLARDRPVSFRSWRDAPQRVTMSRADLLLVPFIVFCCFQQ